MRAGTANGNNNDYAMTYVDIDNDATTFNSSQATLTLPSGATVLWAGLYWGADTTAGTGGVAAPTPASANQARFATPTATAYTTLTATQFDSSPYSGNDFQSFANVTSLVAAGQSGIYRVANVQAGTGADRDAGWALVVAYSAPGLTPKNLTIFDGYAVVNTTAPTSITIPVSGFQTPPAGAVNTRIGVVAYEGDQNFTGDQLLLNSTNISNSLNPTANVFNSSVTSLATQYTAKNPDYRNQLGFDIDTFDASGILPNSATSANITLTTTSEFYYPGVVTFATDVYAPILDVTKTVTDLSGNDVNGSNVQPNQVLNYTLTYRNAGTTANPSRDDSIVVVLRDAIPAGLTYVPGSLTVLSGPNVGTKTDAAGDDQAEVTGGQAVFRVGTGATAAAGGRVNINESGSVRFQVRTPTTGTGRDPFNNQATSTYTGALSGVSLTGSSNLVTSYVNYSPQLSATKTDALLDADGDGVAEPGDSIGYTVVIRNTGNAASTTTVFRDAPDPNTALVAGSVTTTAGTIASGNNGVAPVQVNIGSLAAGAQVTITFRAAIVIPLPPDATTVTNQGSVTSANTPSLLTDDPDSATVGDATDTGVTAQALLNASKQAVLAVDADGNGIPSPGDTLEYRFSLGNSGNRSAAGAVLRDILDVNTALIVGSVQTSQGSVTLGNSAGNDSVEVNLGVLAGGTTATVTFRAVIRTPLPAGVRQVCNAATLTTAPSGVAAAGVLVLDPACTTVVSAPRVDAFKRALLLVDADANAIPSPGDTLLYNVEIRNDGNSAATGLVFVDQPDANTALVAGSVRTDVGTVALGNATGNRSVRVTIPALGGGGGIVDISFSVVINAPLPAGISQVRNQGTLSATNAPATVSDDPMTAASDDPTVTVVTASPLVELSKRATLLIDADNNGTPSPGDTLLYSFELRNDGNAAAADLVFADTVGANTSLVAGTVQTSIGTVDQGNAAGDTVVRVTLGALDGGGASASVSFRAAIANPLPAGVNQVSNQAVVSASNGADVLSDNPDTPEIDDPTLIGVSASPVLSAIKRDTLLTDADNNGVPSPGDTLLYTVELRNDGNADAAGVSFTDVPDSNTALVVGSVQTSVGTVGSGNAAGDTDVAVTIGTLPGGSSANVQFAVTIDNPLPAGVTQISNQGTASAANAPSVLTRDPDTLLTDDATITVVVASPLPLVTKQVQLEVDANNNGLAEPGDTLRYNVRIQNRGNANLAGAVFSDPPDPNTTLVVGSVQASQGTVSEGNTAGDTSLSVALGVIAGGASADVSFSVTINAPLAAGIAEVRNQGTLTATNAAAQVSDDPATTAVDDATVTSITASPRLDFNKRDTLLTDADGNGVPSPGDTLLYSIELRNDGNAAASGLVFADTVGASTTLVAGSVRAGQGTVDEGNTAGDSAVRVTVGVLNGGGAGTMITFNVVIASPLPAGVTQVANQGFVSGANVPDELSGDPDTTELGDPTITAVTANPLLNITKRDTLLTDADGNGTPSPGDTLLYTVELRNDGNANAAGVTFADTPDTNTALVVGSVQTSVGTVGSGNTAGNRNVAINVGTLPGGSSANVQFAVTINNPLPAGVTQVGNQGTVSATNYPSLVTDNPDTLEFDDRTVTVVVANPQPVLAKQALLEVDVNGNGVAEPGDQLSYSVRIQNRGNADLADAVFSDPPAPNTTLAVGSVQASQGTVSEGNTAGDSTVRVELGTIAGGSEATISFSVVIVSPLPAGVTQISNQGLLISGNAPAVVSDDPATTLLDDPTIVPVTAQPRMSATKRSVLIDAGTQDGVAGPGDTLLYEVVLRNTGNTAATNVAYSDTPDASTPLVVGSVVASPGATVTQGNSAGNTTVGVTIGSLAADSSLLISYRVTIPASLPASVTRIQNQGAVTGGNFSQLPTDDPDTPEVDDPTLTALRFPLLVGTKRASLEVDADNSVTTTSGDRLIYTIDIENRGPAAATGVVINDTPDPNTQLVAGSVVVSGGTVTLGNGAGDTSVRVEVGSVAPNTIVSISFSVVISNPTVTSFDRVSNQATIGTANAGSPLSDDPATAAPGDPTVTPVVPTPTAITLLSFTASRGEGGNTIRWTTGVELNTAGFHLYRSADGKRSSAVRITPQLVPARGKAGGASYEWVDSGADAGTDYSYWLQEVESNGATHEFGPIRSSVAPAQQRRSFLPFVQ